MPSYNDEVLWPQNLGAIANRKLHVNYRHLSSNTHKYTPAVLTEGYRSIPKATEGCRRPPKADVGDIVCRRQGRIQGGGSSGLLMRPEHSETKAKSETRECETEIETETKNLL